MLHQHRNNALGVEGVFEVDPDSGPAPVAVATAAQDGPTPADPADQSRKLVCGATRIHAELSKL